MKILYVITGLEKGGAETQMSNLILNMNRKEFEIKLIAFGDGHFRKTLQKAGVEVRLFLVKKKSLFNFFPAVRFLREEIDEFNPDIVHSWLSHANILSKLSTFRNKSKFRLIVSIRVKEIRFLMQNIGERFLDLKSDLVIVNSYTIYNFLTHKLKFRKSKVKVIYNGLSIKNPDMKRFAKLKKEFGRKKLILTVGNFRQQKDYTTNIKTALELSKKRDDFTFLYVGCGSEMDKVKRMAEEFRLRERVKFLGKRDDVAELMLISDALFHPSLYEGQSNVLIEAMYYNLPIVCTKIPENIEIAENAKFSEKRDFKSFANNINKVLDSKKMKKKELNNSIKKKFDIKKMVKKYEEIYRKCAE